ncbi:MAG TPA: hypothetical protein VLM91_06645, partial [Candidatus Methylomirabilis sp.]|nr:hypothetical protein [Candidatus Methylomirabilis sp.]
MMHPSRFIAPSASRFSPLLLAAIFIVVGWAAVAQAATSVLISGEIERISITDRNDHWSGGTLEVGGQRIILPKNLLIDLPANRLTLKQIFDQAPAACLATGETGLAKGDRCNPTGTGGFATLTANRTTAGNVIAGDVLIQKGIEVVAGTVTYISYTDGYVRLDGIPGDPATGSMIRLNDPDSRHTVQQGAGCAGGPNCSPDPRFTLDPDNYTNVFSTGYPYCIPSTVQRTVTTGLPALIGIPALPAGTVAQAQAVDGSGDALCPLANRPATGPVADSRLFAPIKLGDPLTAEGNWETVGGVRFLSAHSTTIKSGLTTKLDQGQPDYMFLEEVGIDMPAWQNQRIRTLIIGFATVAPADVLIWSIHRDAQTNAAHEFPLATVRGCDTAAGPAVCSGQGLVAGGGDIFRIRHDVDFLAGAKARLNPCAHLQADPRMGTGFCPGTALDQTTPPFDNMIGILSPIPHEIQARTGKKLASLQGGTPLVTLDINGNEATNGQYLFPFGMNLGGLAFVEFVEIDLNALATPFSFTGLPWALDRRLSPGGCIDTNGDGIPDCETTPQPLVPFPWEVLDPRTQASIPAGSYSDPNFTATPLGDTRNRMFSFVNPNRTRPGTPGIPETQSGNFDGNTLLVPGSFPPADPTLIPITPVTPVSLVCVDTQGAGGGALLTVVGGGNGSGTVNPVPVGSSIPFDLNAQVTLTATPAVGSVFTQFTNCPGAIGTTCTVTLA